MENHIKQGFVSLLTKTQDERVRSLVRDLYGATKARLEALEPTAIPSASIIDFSAEIREIRELFHRFFRDHIYNDVRIISKNSTAIKYINNLFTFFSAFFRDNPERLPWHMSFDTDAFMKIYFEALPGNDGYAKWKPEVSMLFPGCMPPAPALSDWRYAMAAADLISFMTDAEVIQAVEELGHPHSYRGMAIIEMCLDAFPNQRYWSQTQQRIQNERDELTKFLMREVAATAH